MEYFIDVEENKIDVDLIKKTFNLLKVRIPSGIKHENRFITYFQIINELISFGLIDELDDVKTKLRRNKDVHLVFRELVYKDTTNILSVFRNDIKHYDYEDFSLIYLY